MSALASLTANYTDSEDEGTTPSQRSERRHSEEIPTLNEPQQEQIPSPQLQIPNSAPAVSNPEDDKKANNLVSYFEDHDIVMSDEEIDRRSDIDEEDILPPEPHGKCSKELQDKIARLHEKMEKEGMDLNYSIQNRKNFRNPSIYEKLLQFCNINELGTNYPPHLYDPLRWGKESFYEELGRLQKEDMEKRQKERKEKTKVEVVSGTKKTSVSVPNVSNNSHKQDDKKSKWDLTTSATGTKGTVISAFGSLPKKQKLDIH